MASAATAAASLATMSITAADSGQTVGTPARARPAAESEPATPPMAPAPAGAEEQRCPDSLAAQSPPGAKVISAVADLCAENDGPVLKGKITCDFSKLLFTFTPESNPSEMLSIDLCDVKNYELIPQHLKLKLTLSSGRGLESPGVLPTSFKNRFVFAFRWKTVKKFEEMAVEVRRALVFRSGSFEADFILGQLVGKGGNGECYEVQRRDAPDAPQLCVKMPIKGRLTDMQNEVKLMRELGDCEYIVRFVAYYRVGEGANLQQHIVMELMDGGDLHEHIIERIALRGDTVAAMDEAEVRQVTWRMLQGLKYMHDVKKMMHRDIKPGNVLLAKRGVDGLGDPTTAKLSDFGTSRQMGDLSRANTLGLGTVAYTAPEISAAELSGTTAAQGGYTNACDVWSVGVSLYVMLVQVYPCGTANNAHEARGVREKVLQGLVPGSAAYKQLHESGSRPGCPAHLYAARSADARDLLDALMQVDPRARPTAAAALKHKWFNGM